jgi:hypothetical protein
VFGVEPGHVSGGEIRVVVIDPEAGASDTVIGVTRKIRLAGTYVCMYVCMVVIDPEAGASDTV